MLTLFLGLLQLLYAPWVADLGHSVYRTRERAQLVLERSWPLSEPALQVGRTVDPDMEVRRRCRHATPMDWRVVWKAFCLLRAQPLHRQAEVHRLVLEWADSLGIDTTNAYYFSKANYWIKATGHDELLRILALRGWK